MYFAKLRACSDPFNYPEWSICDGLKRVMIDGFNRKPEFWRHAMIASFLSELLQALCRSNQLRCQSVVT